MGRPSLRWLSRPAIFRSPPSSIEPVPPRSLLSRLFSSYSSSVSSIVDVLEPSEQPLPEIIRPSLSHLPTATENSPSTAAAEEKSISSSESSLDDILTDEDLEEGSLSVQALNALECSYCGAHLAHLTDENLLSEAFTGKHGPARLFKTVVNTSLSKVETRRLLTGPHEVADAFCSCGQFLGWHYIAALNREQKYKVGCTVLENLKTRKITL